MSGNARHYFPGNNTPKGFFSYYHYILDQKEAKRIWCLKGGPGTGKSSFMKKIGDTLLDEGYNVDFLHCSSDSDSLDGILLRDLHVSMVDGTSPHVIDPVNPGAVDTIINLGDYWDEGGIINNRRSIIETKERIGPIYAKAYNYLRAAESMYDNISEINGRNISKSVAHGIAKEIIKDEMNNAESLPHTGKLRKFFASAITPEGLRNFIPELIGQFAKVYILKSDVGAGTEKIITFIMQTAVSKGFDTEAFYCPLKPEEKPEHLLIPQLSLAVITANRYHDIVLGSNHNKLVEIDLRKQGDIENLTLQDEIALDSGRHMEELLTKAVNYLGKAKEEHDILESYYIPYMNFERIEGLRLEIEDQIRQMH